MSPAHLHWLFRDYLGISPMAYVAGVRLNRAAAFLADPHCFLSIKEIAGRCGIMDDSNFTRAFKKRFGMTPTAYRRQAWEVHQSHQPKDGK